MDQSYGVILVDLFIQCVQQIFIEWLLYARPLGSAAITVNRAGKTSAPQKLMLMVLFIYMHLQVFPVQTEDTASFLLSRNVSS